MAGSGRQWRNFFATLLLEAKRLFAVSVTGFLEDCPMLPKKTIIIIRY